MSPDYAAAAAHVQALTGQSVNIAVCDFRMIHDTRKDVPAIPLRGTLPNVWQAICGWNAAGYGGFIAVNQSDGLGREIANFQVLRAHVIDGDDLATSAQSYAAANSWVLKPSFAVISSPGKFHAYWPVTPYADAERYSTIQRKLIAHFQTDPQIIDVARVMRLAGTIHGKNPAQLHLVTIHPLSGYGYVTAPESFEYALSNVVVSDHSGGRSPLGDPAHAAPSLEWAKTALLEIDPNKLSRGEWITVLSAFKQSSWSLTTPDEAFNIFSQWCARYTNNDPGENLKQWNSIRSTEVGWTNLSRRSPNVMAFLSFGDPSKRKPPTVFDSGVAPMPMPSFNSEILTYNECAEYFKGCYFVERFGTILTPTKRQMNQTQFKGAYGGKRFVVDSEGKLEKSPWEAALNSTLWTVPKVDHIRFLPHEIAGSIVEDDLGRKGVNTYRPANIVARPGDITPFLRHMEFLLPHATDRELYIAYLAHNARFPGHKIPWAPLIQSEEGAGKGVIKIVISHVMGSSYVYFPKAKELTESGAKFNAWMRERLFILVDEIKVDDRRDLIEVLKPMITEPQIEIEGKNQNQEVEDNYSNWAFFSNFKDAIPIRKNGRRFTIFYSAIQSVEDLIARGMDERYFTTLYDWLNTGGGKEAVAYYLLNYPIERGAIPMRAPNTTSTAEALEQSRGPLEQLLHELVEDRRPGFCGGWASTVSFMRAAREAGLQVRSAAVAGKVFEQAGYRKIGRAVRDYFQEMGQNGPARTTLYSIITPADLTAYGRSQGYE